MDFEGSGNQGTGGAILHFPSPSNNDTRFMDMNSV